jgi:hypothetical protein
VAIWEACLAILGWYGRERVGFATRNGWYGSQRMGFTKRIGGSGRSSVVLPRGLEGPVDLKSKGRRAPDGFDHGFGALGGRG